MFDKVPYGDLRVLLHILIIDYVIGLLHLDFWSQCKSFATRRIVCAPLHLLIWRCHYVEHKSLRGGVDLMEARERQTFCHLKITD